MSSQVDELMVECRCADDPVPAMVAGIMLGLSVTNRYVQHFQAGQGNRDVRALRDGVEFPETPEVFWETVDTVDWIEVTAVVSRLSMRGVLWIRVVATPHGGLDPFVTTDYVYAHN